MTNTFKLTNRKHPDKFGSCGMDFKFDESGLLVRLTGTDKVEQEVRKIILCSPTDWGYGCGVANLIGEKLDMQMSRGVISQLVVDALSFLTALQTDSSGVELMDQSEIIYAISRVQTSEDGPDGYKLDLDIVTTDANGFSTTERVLGGT